MMIWPNAAMVSPPALRRDAPRLLALAFTADTHKTISPSGRAVAGGNAEYKSLRFKISESRHDLACAAISYNRC
ncbi:hypothetical protein KCP74_11550 [Salmonella enterica subsp. enterica]|nr:hypothetical protein KCP74_11550 [Salmonella enterica subsp. enterica]